MGMKFKKIDGHLKQERGQASFVCKEGRQN